MNTKAKIVFGLKVLGSRWTELGIKATVALHLGDEKVFLDEVKLWQAKSREMFIKRCLKVLEHQRGRKIKKGKCKNIREWIDRWLQDETVNF